MLDLVWSCKSIRMKNITLLLFCIVAWHAKLMANTIKASSPSQANVQTAINSAGNDDTVIVPAGTANWSSTLVFTKGITLVGSTTTDSVAGTAKDQTIIQDSVPRVSGSGPFIKITTVLGNFYRVSGFTFQNGSATTSSVNGAIQILGDSHSVRLDHCHFMPMTYQGPDVQIKGAIFGVADHNVLNFGRAESFTFYMGNWPNPDGSAGQRTLRPGQERRPAGERNCHPACRKLAPPSRVRHSRFRWTRPSSGPPNNATATIYCDPI